MKVSDEKKRLEEIAKDFTMESGLTKKVEAYFIEKIKKDLKKGRLLEIGCADGYLSKMLSEFPVKITAIDGSKKLIDKARRRKLRNVKFINTLYEEYKPEIQFDTIILSDILEHVSDPVDLLRKTKKWLKKNGRSIVISPNAYSLHRQIGVLAGMLGNAHDLNATDLKVGHRRVYDIKLLKAKIKKAELKVIKEDGFFLKPLSDVQMEDLPNEVINAFYLIGKKIPKRFLALLYVVASK